MSTNTNIDKMTTFEEANGTDMEELVTPFLKVEVGEQNSMREMKRISMSSEVDAVSILQE